MVLALAACFSWALHHLDIKSAFLQGDLLDEVYLRLPEGFTAPSHLVCQLRKPLYGLRQAPRAWYSKIHEFFLSQGLRRSTSDPGLYLLEERGQRLMVLLYVDDLLITGDYTDRIQDLQAQLSKHFEISALGLMDNYLRLEFFQSTEGILMCQSTFILKLLDDLGLESCNAATTLMAEGLHLSTDMEARYLKGTIDYGLLFKRTGDDVLQAFTDADWAGDTQTRKSTSGYAFKLGESYCPGAVRNNPQLLYLPLKRNIVC
ncbi:hypothetical protein R1sor_008593 [Riccia sorocarpa]|uniref:Reverse transcriptase Ty1/copia-type domain-containing protein n=1 Tax=Riccia sorocarpa TaxID=122646 RepID=A0ABD3HWP2_9MARC